MSEFADFELPDIDFTNIPVMTGEFSVLPIGKYRFDIKHVKQDASKSTNNPMIVVTFEVAEVLEAPGVENPDALVGQKAWNNYSLLPQSLGRLKNLMVAANASLDKFRAAELIDVRIEADITHNQGDQRVDANGIPLPVKTFANIVNERPMAEAAPPAKAAGKPVATPPVANKAPSNKAPANGARRG